MAVLKTQTDTMMTASHHVMDIAQQIHQEMTGLQSRLSVLDGAWQGSARVIFDQLMMRWNDTNRQLNEALNSIAETIKANGVAYQEAQDDHTAQLKSLNF